MSRTGPPRAVTFDFWDTLVQAPVAEETRAARVARLESLLRDGGVDLEDGRLEAAIARVVTVFNEHWKANRQFTHVEAVDALIDHLDLALADELRAELTSAFTGERVESYLPPLTPNVAECLRRLRDAGVRLGIVCDVGLSPSTVLRRHLVNHGVLGLFDHWSFSDEVGHYKPAPAIFEHALAGLGGVSAAEAAHVGDLRRTDVAGARAMGMLSVRYRGITDDPETDGGVEADLVIDDHAALPGLLGL